MGLITPTDAAKRLGVSTRTLRNYIKSGKVDLAPVRDPETGKSGYDEMQLQNIVASFQKPSRGRPRTRPLVEANGHPKPPKPDTDLSLAEQVVEYLETFDIVQGDLRGQKFQVLPWQRPVIDDLFTKNVIALTVARANGKSGLIGAIACAFLLGPLAEPYAEIDIFASSLKQAKIAFDHAVRFIGKDRLKTETWLPPGATRKVKRFRYLDSVQTLSITDNTTGIVMQALGSDPKRIHGLAPSVAIGDEPAQWEGEQGGAEMWAAIYTAFGKQSRSLAILLGTKSDQEDHFFNGYLDMTDEPEVGVHDYSNDKELDAAEQFTEEAIRRANPSYDYMPELRARIESARNNALKRGGNYLKQYKAMRLNMGTPLVLETEQIVTMENWRACIVPIAPPRQGPCFIGFDLGTSDAMSACAFYWPDVGRLEAYAAFPADPDLEERGERDGVKGRYVKMFERKELKVYPGKETNNVLFLDDMTDLVAGEDIRYVSADRHKHVSVMQAMTTSKAPWGVTFRPVGAGPLGGEDVRGFQREVLSGHLKIQRSLIMDSAIMESILRYDGNGNPALDKRRANGRIDPLSAAIIACGEGHRYRVPYDGRTGNKSDWAHTF